MTRSEATPLSPRNPRVAALGRLVRQRRERAEQGRFVIDGPVLVTEALAADIVLHDVFVDPAAVERPDVVAAVEAACAAGAAAWAVEGGLARVLDVVSPHGLAAVGSIPVASAEVPGDLLLALDGVSDPGNLGTLLRTAEAVGARVHLGEGTVDPWSPKVVRASAGSVLRVPVGSGAIGPALAAWSDRGARVVGATARGGALPEEVALTGPVAIVVGSEAHGLSAEAADAVSTWVSVPMAGAVESLNVAVAGSVLAFEVRRQRRAADRGTADGNGLVGPTAEGAG